MSDTEWIRKLTDGQLMLFVEKSVEWLGRMAKEAKEAERPAEKAGRWEYCEVRRDAYVWRYWREDGSDSMLHFAFSEVGFGGIEYAEAPGVWMMGMKLAGKEGLLWASENPEEDKDYKPARPIRVRFWREG